MACNPIERWRACYLDECSASASATCRTPRRCAVLRPAPDHPLAEVKVLVWGFNAFDGFIELVPAMQTGVAGTANAGWVEQGLAVDPLIGQVVGLFGWGFATGCADRITAQHLAAPCAPGLGLQVGMVLRLLRRLLIQASHVLTFCQDHSMGAGHSVFLGTLGCPNTSPEHYQTGLSRNPPFWSIFVDCVRQFFDEARDDLLTG